jgi:hypothetical protein
MLIMKRIFRQRWSTIPPNINKMNDHFSPEITEHEKTPRYMTLEIQALAWNRHRNRAGLHFIQLTNCNNV